MSMTLKEGRPWTTPWWKPARGNVGTFIYLILIHVLAVVGIILFPLPGWKVFGIMVALAFIGGFGTTLAYHRSLAHRSVKFNPVVEQVLIFIAVFSGSGVPSSWIANHRNHHANADSAEDVSSPRHGGFWWAHIRWVYQWPASDMRKWCPDLIHQKYLFWTKAQPLILFFSLSFGYLLFGWPGLFWLGSIRLVYMLHCQMSVNSILHLKPGLADGVDTSRNIWWLGFFLLWCGEHLHGNHHSKQASAKFSKHWWQPDFGWYVICLLSGLGLATKVRA